MASPPESGPVQDGGPMPGVFLPNPRPPAARVALLFLPSLPCPELPAYVRVSYTDDGASVLTHEGFHHNSLQFPVAA